ncbi:MAG: bacillithiol biosynthesis deacetylase BshB1 [Acidobacteria bacterium]|nr:bacillithiol biosynthesis deacetylase BshB1 [Acidobacteriota bacterium]
MENVDVLTIAAHPDDIELTCAGTLIRMVDKGYSVGILDLTQGEMGTRGTPEIRAREAEAAREVIGARFREQLDFGDSRLVASIENRIALAEKIRRARPTTVILPYWEGRHPDHYTAATLGYEACYAAGLKQLPVAGEPYRPRKILYAAMYWEVRPSFLVDISPYFERKLQAINCFASQFSGDLDEIAELYPAWGRLIDRITTQCKYFGHLMGVEYAEPFVVKEVMAVDDIVNLPVTSV